MTSNTNEQALESAIEKRLTGSCREEQDNIHILDDSAERSPLYRSGHGYYIGEPSNFNKKYAIDEHHFWHFLETTQPDELAKLQRQSNWQQKILERLDRLVKKYGILRILRKGLKVDDADLTLFYQLPLASSSQQVKENFDKNQFSVTRQIQYSSDNPLEEIDMVIFINGLPISTMELKNPWTGQNARVHGINQYKNERDFHQPLLNFGRCIVHFAVDPDDIYMTTRLQGAQTYFLPFNQGHNYGKGNPPNPFGHKTSYLWEEILTKESLANIIQHFVRFDGKDGEALSKRTLFFPRYHQLQVVRKILKDVSTRGVGDTYLVQHSAGSGKSNSITWTAFQLIEVYPEDEEVIGNRGMENPLYDSVIVVTDRRLLDKQIKDNIKEFSVVKNIVAHAKSSMELKQHLESGKKIIISTIQKFPFIVDGIADLSDRNFAVIIDEAHSSQSGQSADNLNVSIGQNNEEDYIDNQDKIINAMQARKMRGNASYFAFTATPKNTTLEKFGTPQEDGSFKPFDLYSMKQAIEEGFILDVLANYTTYRSYYQLEKSIEDNPLFDTTKAQKRLRAYVERHPDTIKTKAEIMLDHFVKNIYNTKKLRAKAKAIVATQNIESAIRYYKALSEHLGKIGNPFKILIAFSGIKEVDGIEYTEASVNGFSQGDTKDAFDSDEYRILVVANKYLTGFDQPKLTTMYVDKKLQYVMAVQALSRLNRSAPKYGKKTEDLFILDFFNTIDEMKHSFDPFYTSTTLSEPTDINVLHELKENLEAPGVFEQHEVEEFNVRFFNNVDAQLLSPIIDVAADRFNHQLDFKDEEKADYKIKAKQFVKIYGQVAAFIPYEMIEWEKLFWFLKFLIPKLIIKDPDKEALDELLESIDLSTYGLQRTRLNNKIELEDAESELDPQNPNPRGTRGGEKNEDPLDEIIRNFNERWFKGWDTTSEEQRVKFITISKNIAAHPDFQEKFAENKDTQHRELALKKILNEVMTKQRKNELNLYRLYTQDDSFKQAFYDTVKRLVSTGL